MSNINYFPGVEQKDTDTSGETITIYRDFRDSLVFMITSDGHDIDSITNELISGYFENYKIFLENLYSSDSTFLYDKTDEYTGIWKKLGYDEKVHISRILYKDLRKFDFLKLIHCIGDSHACFFSGGGVQPQWPALSRDILPFFRSYRLGPTTACNLVIKTYMMNQIVGQKVDKDKDRIVFCFGEVDCRVHVRRLMERNSKSMEDVVGEMVKDYMDVVVKYKNKGLDIGVWGPIASYPDNHMEAVHLDFMLNYEKMKDFGSCLERNKITKYFNEKVEERCKEEGIHFVTLFYEMVDENLITKGKYLDYAIHLNNDALPVSVKEFEKKNLI